MAELAAAAQLALQAVWSAITAGVSAYVSNVLAAFQSFEGRVHSAVNDSGTNASRILQAQTAGVTFLSSLIGLNGVLGEVFNTLDSVLSTPQPFLPYFSLSWLASELESAIGSVSPLGSALGYVSGLVGAREIDFGSGLGTAISHAGGGAQVSWGSAPVWYPPLPGFLSYLSGGAGIGVPAMPTWLNNATTTLDNPGTATAFVAMAAATAWGLAYLTNGLVRGGLKGSGGAGSFLLEEGGAIALTIVGWLVLFKGGNWRSHLSSMELDGLSLSLRLDEVFGGGVTGPYERALTGMDMGADVIDLGVYASGIG